LTCWSWPAFAADTRRLAHFVRRIGRIEIARITPIWEMPFIANADALPQFSKSG